MRKRVFLALVLIGGLLSLIWLAGSKSTASKSLTKAEPSTTPSMPSKEAVSAKLAGLERGWVKNEGQWDERALFSAPGYFGNTWVTKEGELLHVAVKKEECKDKTIKAKACPSKSWVISERWVGGKVQTIKGEEELQTKVSYFVGNSPSKHKTNLPTYRYVSLGEVWSGVKIKLKATQKTVEKLFYIKPGADPSKIQVQVDVAEGLKLSKDGEIIIRTGLVELKLSKPIAWQEKDGKKLPVEVSYKLIGKNRYSFEVAQADPSLPIVIDPILQSTYLGGSGIDYANALAIHPTTGEVYVAGYTSSNNFPMIHGGADTNFSGGTEAFVAKLTINLTNGNILSINPTPTNGRVTSSPSAINCGSGVSMCSADFSGMVTLTATPSTGYTFAEWTGDCYTCGTSTTCTITMTASKTCSANFTASGGGSGGGGDGSGGGGDGSGGGSGSGGDGSSSGGGGSSSGGGSGTGGSGSGGGGGGGCSMTGSASSMAGLWNILVWLAVPAFALARRIRKK